MPDLEATMTALPDQRDSRPRGQHGPQPGQRRHESFASLAGGALNWESFPLRLWRKGNKKFWDPAGIDFSQDARDWQGLTDEQRAAALGLCASFLAGEEAVTHDIRPFMSAMEAEGRLGDELYLTQFCFEEAKHTQGFRLWMDAVGATGDLNPDLRENPGYRAIFYEELPAAMYALQDDPSPASQVRASVTYNHVVEGSLALTGYHSWNRICTGYGIFPGMQQLIKHIGDDERRHMAWGTFTCRRHVAADDTNWQVVQDRIAELTPHVLALVQYRREDAEEAPFGILPRESAEYATNRLARRLGAIESARGVPVERIDVDTSPEQLEEDFAREDAEAVRAAS